MENKQKWNVKNLFKTKRQRMIAIITAIVLVAILAIGILLTTYNRTPKVSSEMLISTLERASELTTAKLNYTGMSEFKDSGIAFINRSDFIMIYKATVRAGIDVSEVEVDVDNSGKIVWLTIPKAEIQEVKVDASSIKYFDEKFSLFNFDSKEDSNQAIALAEEEAKKEAANIGVLDLADQQSATLIKGILQEAIPDEYTVKIR